MIAPLAWLDSRAGRRANHGRRRPTGGIVIDAERLSSEPYASANSPEIQAYLDKACELARPPQQVVADLSQVAFLGSAGLSMLMEVDEWCRERRTPLLVVATTPGVVRPLRVTGVDQVLQVTESLDRVVRMA